MTPSGSSSSAWASGRGRHPLTPDAAWGVETHGRRIQMTNVPQAREYRTTENDAHGTGDDTCPEFPNERMENKPSRRAVTGRPRRALERVLPTDSWTLGEEPGERSERAVHTQLPFSIFFR